MSDYRTAPIDARLRATLGLLEKMTLHHSAITAADVRAVLDAGVSKAAINDAIEVAYLFNIYDRLADTMGWHVPETRSGYYKVAANRLLSRGYQ